MERYYNEDTDDKDKEPFFGDGDDDDDDEDGEEIMEGEAMAFIDQQGLIDVMHMDLAQTELNQHLLSKAIEIAEKSWFWCFRSSDYKMKEIEAIYKRLVKLTADESEEEKEDEEEGKSSEEKE